MTTETIVPQATNGELDKVAPPPYISFLTFFNCIDWLEKEGIPHRFDRSFWSRKYGGSVGPYVVSAFRFLGLLEGESPQPSLETLVKTKGDERKAALRDILKHAYKHVNFELLPKATPGMLAEWMGKYGQDGDTKRKAQAFLINGLKFSDTPVSPSLKKLARNRAQSAGRRTSRDKSERPVDPKPKPVTPDGQSSTKLVELHGATVTLTVTSADLIELAAYPDELKWFQELLLKFNEKAAPSKG